METVLVLLGIGFLGWEAHLINEDNNDYDGDQHEEDEND